MFCCIFWSNLWSRTLFIYCPLSTCSEAEFNFRICFLKVLPDTESSVKTFMAWFYSNHMTQRNNVISILDMGRKKKITKAKTTPDF